MRPALHAGEATAEIEGIYGSRVEAGTSAGPGCFGGPNRVEALAQDEASLQANGSAMFEGEETRRVHGLPSQAELAV